MSATPGEELVTHGGMIMEELLRMYEKADVTATYLARLIANRPAYAEQFLEEEVAHVLRHATKGERAAVVQKIREARTYYQEQVT